MYRFYEPLKEGIILKRNSRFSMDVLINGEVIKCHCPTTGRIGDIEMKKIACLISHSQNKSRKLPYTVEAISCDSLDTSSKEWIGINQILSNKLIKHFLDSGQLKNMISNNTCIKREVAIGKSKLERSGIETWEIEFCFTHEGISLFDCRNSQGN